MMLLLLLGYFLNYRKHKEFVISTMGIFSVSLIGYFVVAVVVVVADVVVVSIVGIFLKL